METTIKLETALVHANALCDALRPWCERIEIGGSIRRLKPEVKDIELVCIPRSGEDGTVFATVHMREFAAHVMVNMKVLAGDPMKGRYVKGITPAGIKVDLFMCRPENWGYIFCLRTGSAEHNIKLVQHLKHNGYKCDGGNVLWKGQPLELREEGEVFQRAGMKYIDPQFRTVKPARPTSTWIDKHLP